MKTAITMSDGSTHFLKESPEVVQTILDTRGKANKGKALPIGLPVMTETKYGMGYRIAEEFHLSVKAITGIYSCK